MEFTLGKYGITGKTIIVKFAMLISDDSGFHNYLHDSFCKKIKIKQKFTFEASKKPNKQNKPKKQGI